MIRVQIGRALGYSDPKVAISKLHDRHKDRLDKFSGVTKLVTSGGTQDTCMYNARGIYEICRWSQQPRAAEFFDWVYDALEGLRKGELALQNHGNVSACTGQPDSKYLEAQIKLVYQMTREFKGMVGTDEEFKLMLLFSMFTLMLISLIVVVKAARTVRNH